MGAWKRAGLFFVLILFFTLAGLAAVSAAMNLRNEIHHGVHVGPVAVGGLTEAAAAAVLEADAAARLRQAPPVLTYQERRWPGTAAELSLRVDTAALAHEAYLVGRKGPFWEQIRAWYLAAQQGWEVPYRVDYDQEQVRGLLARIAAEVERPARNAELDYQRGKVHLQPEQTGLHLEPGAAWGVWERSLSNFGSPELPLPVREEVPGVLAQDLAGIDSLLAGYSTFFNSQDANRAQNVSLAARSIDHTLVRAGTVFSFNARVGKRTAANGYKEAPAFINGKLVPDWGGGVCQVSSTLYNAVLLAGLAIEERTSHYSPPGYVPLGQDATVADGQLDFQFRNTTSQAIYVRSMISGNQLTVQLFGRDDGQAEEIRIVPRGKQVLPPPTIFQKEASLEEGMEVVEQEGRNGYKIGIERIRLRQGQEVGREQISYDEFPLTERIVRVGTKAAMPPASK